jgi:Tfp pilus assembly protein PilX
MKSATSLQAQRGATLVMGLILLAVLMLTVTVSFMMSNNNLKSISNMQFRAEAAAAADAAVEKLISTDAIFRKPVATTIPADADADAYGMAVSIDAPKCMRSVEIEAGSSADATPTFYQEGNLNLTAQGYMETYWDIHTKVTNVETGSLVEVYQGIMIVLPSEPPPCV